jgi:dihydroorotase
MHELVLSGRFVLGGDIVTGSVGIDSGRITKISRRELKGESILRFERELILPGLLDTHVHLRDFEQREKETVESGTKAALHGGITAVFDMPNTKPPVMDSETFKKRLNVLEGKAYTDYAVGFLLSGNCGEASNVRADFYKIFMGASTGGIFSDDFEGDYSCAPGIASVHAEHPEVIRENPNRPPEAEIKAVRKALNWAEKLRKPLNICHVSTAGGIKEIIRKNLPWVSFEVTPHHLFLTKKDFERNPLLKVYPPLRGEEDRKALWRNFSRIPIIASDHAPHTIEDKEAGAAGIPGLETEVALLLDAANRGFITIFDIVEKMHDNPVRFFRIRGRDFESGNEATFTIVDPKREWVVEPEEFYTKAKWSPWDGKKLKGKVVMTVIRGKAVMEDDEIIGRPEGVRVDVQGGDH